EFEAFLQRRTLLPHGDDALEPSRALDQIVLQQARVAIQGGSQSPRAARWATPVALAATILLCLSIVLNVTLNTNRPARSPEALDKPAPSSAPSAPMSLPAPSAPMSLPAPSAPMSLPAPSAPTSLATPSARAERAREKALDRRQ